MSNTTVNKVYLPIKYNGEEKTVNFPIVFLSSSEQLEAFIDSQDSTEKINIIIPNKVQKYDLKDIDVDLLTINSLDMLESISSDNSEDNKILNHVKKIIINDKLFSISPSSEGAKQLKGLLLGLPILLKQKGFKKLDKINDTSRKLLVNKLSSYLKLQEPYDSFNSQIDSIEEPVVMRHSGDRLSMNHYVLPNRKDFPKFINSEFTLKTKGADSQRLPIKLWDSEKNKFNGIQPFSHQKFVSDYLNENTPYRGMLLYHGLGSGKSGASILIGEGFPERKVVVMLPASIRTNYLDEIKTFGEVAYKTNFYWQFVELGETTGIHEETFRQHFKSLGIDNKLYSMLRPKIKLGDSKGIWLVDYNKDSNYELLNDIEQKSLGEQIDIMFNYKYTFCNYNAGKYTIIKILEQLVPQYEHIKNKVVGDKSASKMDKTDINNLLNFIYNPINNVENPFDNKVVIVDEIHNLTSGMLGTGFNSPRIYELLMRAKNLKLVLLSGTPVINFPFELGLMLNMLRGFISTINIIVSKKDGIVNPIELETILDNNPYIDRFVIDSKNVKLVRTPVGFMNNYNEDKTKNGVTKDIGEVRASFLDDNEFVLYLRTYLNENNYRIDTRPKQELLTVFPDILNKKDPSSIMIGNPKYLESIEKLFNDTYINRDASDLRNEIAFKNRILGLVSFYNEVSSPEGEEPIFPERITAEIEETEVIMSDYQLIEYLEFREIEREKELKSSKLKAISKTGGDVLGDISKLFKVYTRQRGIFVFPPEIKRPLPPKKEQEVFNSKEERKQVVNDVVEILSQGGDIPTEISVYMTSLEPQKAAAVQDIFSSLVRTKLNLVGEGSDPVAELSKYDWGDQTTIDELEGMVDSLNEDLQDYNTQLGIAISRLTAENLTVNESPYSLEALSPKYVQLLNNIIHSDGNSFVYSQFRAVEGVEIFGKVLQFNGYTKIELTDNELNEKITVENSKIDIGKRVRIIRDRANLKDGTYLSMSYLVIDKVEDEDNSVRFILEGLEDEEFEEEHISLCKFALWTGSESVDARKTILNIYNSSENLLGEKCQVLMTTQSGAEGISLRAVRQVHIMEPYWNNVRIEQVIGRARRTYSHNDLPVEMRNVKVFKYVIKFNPDFLTSKEDTNYVQQNQELISDYLLKRKADMIEDIRDEDGMEQEEDTEEHIRIAKARFSHQLMTRINAVIKDDDGITTDEVLVNISDKKEHILNKFLNLFKEVAVDCRYNLIENVRSDSDLASLSCYEEPINDDSEFTFSLDSNKILEPSYVESATDARQEVVQLSQVIPIKLAKKVVKILVFLPQGVSNYKEVTENTPLYDYYSYYGLNPDTQLVNGSLYQLGEINTDGAKSTFKFMKDRLNIDVIKKLNTLVKCNSELGDIPSFEEERAEYLVYQNRMKLCYNDKMGITVAEVEEPPTQWKCSLCEEENPMETNVCANCGMDRED